MYEWEPLPRDPRLYKLEEEVREAEKRDIEPTQPRYPTPTLTALSQDIETLQEILRVARETGDTRTIEETYRKIEAQGAGAQAIRGVLGGVWDWMNQYLFEPWGAVSTGYLGYRAEQLLEEQRALGYIPEPTPEEKMIEEADVLFNRPPITDWTEYRDWYKKAEEKYPELTGMAEMLNPIFFIPVTKPLQFLGAAGRGVSRVVKWAFSVPSKVIIPEIAPKVAIDKLTQLIKTAKPVRAETEILKHEALSVKAKTAAEILSKGEGAEAFREATGALKGQLPKAQYTAPELSMSTDEVSSLFNYIRDNTSAANFFDGLNTSKALQKVLIGEIPTRGEIAILEDWFGTDLVKAIMSKRTLGQKTWETTRELINLPRAILASFDLSAPLRQGVVLAPGHPGRWTQAIGPMVKAFGSEDYAMSVGQAIRSSKYFDLGQDVGLYIAPLRGVATRAIEREEAFMTKFAQYIPFIRHSERAYVTYLNKLRQSVFDDVARGWEGMGKSVKDYEELALFVNRATGRGGLGPLKNAGDILAAGFFSPRLLTSRFTMPLSLLTSTPSVRRIVARDLAAFFGTGIAILSLVKLSGLGDVELDPRSSDFGKIRIGNTRLEFWGGFQPIVRVIAQLITNQRKTTGAGDIVGLDRDITVARFIQSKLSPQLGFGVDVLRGETFLGEEMSLEKVDVAQQAYNRLTPLFIQDMIDAVQEQGLVGGFIATPGVLGVNIQTFKGIYDVQRDVAAKMFPNKTYEQLNQGQKDQVRASQEVEDATAILEDRAPIKPEQEAAIMMRRYDDVKINLESELRTYIDAGMLGVPLREKIQEFKQDRYKATEVLFSEAVKKVLKGNKDMPLEDMMAEQYWSVPLVENTLTGELDFDSQQKTRNEILKQADDLGISREYITSSQLGSYRGERFADPEVRRIVEEYETAVNILKPYWELTDKVLDLYPRAREILDYIKTHPTLSQLDVKLLKSDPEYKEYDRMITAVRKETRNNNPEIAANLAVWYFKPEDLIITPEAEQLRQEILRRLQ